MTKSQDSFGSRILTALFHLAWVSEGQKSVHHTRAPCYQPPPPPPPTHTRTHHHTQHSRTRPPAAGRPAHQSVHPSASASQPLPQFASQELPRLTSRSLCWLGSVLRNRKGTNVALSVAGSSPRKDTLASLKRGSSSSFRTSFSKQVFVCRVFRFFLNPYKPSPKRLARPSSQKPKTGDRSQAETENARLAAT